MIIVQAIGAFLVMFLGLCSVMMFVDSIFDID